MLLTNQQKFLLEALRRLHCARIDQLARLLMVPFRLDDQTRAERIVRGAMRQLQYGDGRVLINENLVYQPGAMPDRKQLDAVDVMLQLSDATPLDYTLSTSPVLLRFSIQGTKIQVFSVLDSTANVNLACFGPAERLIILLGKDEIAIPIPVPNKQFFARRKEDGSYRFFAPDNKPT